MISAPGGGLQADGSLLSTGVPVCGGSGGGGGKDGNAERSGSQHRGSNRPGQFQPAVSLSGVPAPSSRFLLDFGVSCQGAGRVLCDSGKHPAQLRAEVCTPGGTTIYGLHTLEQGGLRAATMSAVESATERARELGRRSSARCTK